MSQVQSEELSEELPQELPEETNDLNPLPTKQELVLRAVLSHPTLKEAALAAGVSYSTLWRFMGEPAFARRLNEARREIFAHVVQRLCYAAGDAAKALHDIVKDPGAGGDLRAAAVRISAARVILDQARRGMDLDELGARYDKLERFILLKQEQEMLERDQEEEEEDEE